MNKSGHITAVARTMFEVSWTRDRLVPALKGDWKFKSAIVETLPQQELAPLCFYHRKATNRDPKPSLLVRHFLEHLYITYQYATTFFKAFVREKNLLELHFFYRQNVKSTNLL